MDRHDDAFRIFLNYRRQDADTAVGRLWDTLTRGLGGEEGFAEAQLFKDIDTIEPGVDFRVAIGDAVASSDVFLAVIGRDWLTAVDAKGRRRLDNPADFVRMEIEAALHRAEERDDVRVVPTLVQGAEMPAVEELPESLAALAHRNAVELTDARWPYDAGRLLARLKELEQEKRVRVAEERDTAASDELRRVAAEQTEREARERRVRERNGQQADAWDPDEIGHTTRERVDKAPATTRSQHTRRSRRTRLLGAAVAAAAAGAVALAALTLRTPDAPAPPVDPDANWAHAGLPPGVRSLSGVAALPGGEAVAVGGGGNRPRVVVSENGSPWSEETIESGSGHLNAVAASEAAVVAGGIVHDDDDEDGEIWRREGGRWNRVCLNTCGETSGAEPGRQAIYALTATTSGFVAVGVDGRTAAVWTSADGSKWNRAARGDEDLRGETGTASVMNGVTSVGARLVAVGRRGLSGAVWWSDDAGVSWTLAGGVPASAAEEQIVLTAVAPSDSTTAVAVGYRSLARRPTAAVAWISTDGGSNWTDTDFGNASPRGQKLDGVVWDGTSWLAVGQDRPDGAETPVVAAVWRATDGVVWEAVDSASFAGDGDRSMAAAAVVAGRPLAVGSGIWAPVDG